MRARSDTGARLAAFALMLYTHLWIAEGALRKWVPGLDRPFYVARDVLAIGLLVAMMMVGRATTRRVVLLIAPLLALSIWGLTASLSSHASLVLAATGMRTYLAPFLALLIYLAFGTAGVGIRMARIIVAWLPVQAILVVLQSTSAPTARINTTSGEESAQFVSFGVARASGTFTAPAGLTQYLVIALACALLLLLSSSSGRSLARLGVASAVLIAALGGSRGAVLGASVVLAFYVFAAVVSRGARYRRAAVALMVLVLAGTWVTARAFPAVLDAFSRRVADAAESEDTLGRLNGQLLGFLSDFDSALGAGPGAHSQAGIAVGSEAGWIENDAAKWVAELGVLGVALAVLRMALLLGAILWPIMRPTVVGPTRTLLLGAFVASQLVGQITQTPSAQAGFGVLVVLFVAATDLGRVDGEVLRESSARIPGMSSRRRQRLSGGAMVPTLHSRRFSVPQRKGLRF